MGAELIGAGIEARTLVSMVFELSALIGLYVLGAIWEGAHCDGNGSPDVLRPSVSLCIRATYCGDGVDRRAPVSIPLNVRRRPWVSPPVDLRTLSRQEGCTTWPDHVVNGVGHIEYRRWRSPEVTATRTGSAVSLSDDFATCSSISSWMERSPRCLSACDFDGNSGALALTDAIYIPALHVSSEVLLHHLPSWSVRYGCNGGVGCESFAALSLGAGDYSSVYSLGGVGEFDFDPTIQECAE